jgi:CTP:molybdopterin cytidylyltransferase MocA
MIDIILTMAGKYSRFRLFGSKIPKYLLPLGRGTMLSEVIRHLKQSARESKIYLITNRNDQMFFP